MGCGEFKNSGTISGMNAFCIKSSFENTGDIFGAQIIWIMSPEGLVKLGNVPGLQLLIVGMNRVSF